MPTILEQPPGVLPTTLEQPLFPSLEQQPGVLPTSLEQLHDILPTSLEQSAMPTMEQPLSTRPVRACRLRPMLLTPPATPSPTSTPRQVPLRARSTPVRKTSSLAPPSSSISLPATRVPSPHPTKASGLYAEKVELPRRGSLLGLNLDAPLPTPDPTLPPSQTQRRFPCPHPGCSKAYYKPSRLNEHLLTHTGDRPHVCQTCGQSYFRSSHLAAHMRVHKSASEKPFVCSREGCEKRFWTATHVRRHELSHDVAERHVCEQCDSVFPKSHLLREHVAEAHMPEGTKPWLCTEEGCGKSFAMKQQLKTHEKTHDPTRYTCSHPEHDTFPTFPTWTSLQAHMRDAHPPVCPYPECHGRTFKNAARLKDHLKVHAEREEDLAAGHTADPAEHSEEEDVAPVMRSKRKRRKRRRVEEDHSTQPTKLARIANGTAGKDWPCGAPGCRKAFKTKFARDEHAQAIHVRARHKCEACGRAYRRPASLRRHVAEGWCLGAPDAEAKPELEGEKKARKEKKEDWREDMAAELLGIATAPGGKQFRPWTCPYGTHVALHREQGQGEEEEGEEGEEACEERFFRVYDVRRHLGATHGVELGDRETRELLLADGQRGDHEE